MTTTGIKLPVYVYNDFFINCLDNHLIGLLIQRDESFRRVPCAIRSTYSVITPKTKRAEMTKQLPESFDKQGWFLLQVELQRLQLEDWFEQFTVDVSSFQDIHQAIQENLKQGYYVLALLDRFYFPRGVDYQKRHRIHSTFIYGYDESAQVYHLIEDCETFGVMKYYDLSFHDLEVAYRAALEVDPEFLHSTYAFRLNEERDFTYTLPRDAILDNVSYLLEETVVEDVEGPEGTELLQQHFGLSSIRAFADMVGDVYTNLDDEVIHQFIPAGRPLHMQRKNLLTLHYLEQEGFFTDMREKEWLEAGYQELFAKWEIYRNRLFKYILTRDRYPNSAATSVDFGELSRVMHSIYPLEKEVTQRFYEVLSR